MKKRVAAGLLWFYVTWYAWAVIASFVGLTDLVGPVLAALVAALLAGDPMHRIWSRADKPAGIRPEAGTSALASLEGR